MLRAIQLNDDTSFLAKKVHLHVPEIVEWNWQLDVHTKAVGRFWQTLQSAIKKCLAGTPGSSFAFSLGRRNSGCVNE